MLTEILCNAQTLDDVKWDQLAVEAHRRFHSNCFSRYARCLADGTPLRGVYDNVKHATRQVYVDGWCTNVFSSQWLTNPAFSSQLPCWLSLPFGAYGDVPHHAKVV